MLKVKPQSPEWDPWRVASPAPGDKLLFTFGFAADLTGDRFTLEAGLPESSFGARSRDGVQETGPAAGHGRLHAFWAMLQSPWGQTGSAGMQLLCNAAIRAAVPVPLLLWPPEIFVKLTVLPRLPASLHATQ